MRVLYCCVSPIQTSLDHLLKEVEQSFQAPSPGGESARKEDHLLLKAMLGGGVTRNENDIG